MITLVLLVIFGGIIGELAYCAVFCTGPLVPCTRCHGTGNAGYSSHIDPYGCLRCGGSGTTHS